MNILIDGLIPSLLLAAGLFLWLPLLSSDRSWSRVLVLGLVILLTLRYVFWRTTTTLPDLELTFQSLWTWIFYLFETSAIATLVMGYVFQLRTTNRSIEADEYMVKLKTRDFLPSVDVFIPTYNEELSVVERSIIGALALDYPRYTVWVLDDGKREWLREFCKAKGARYVTRPDNQYAKAGNMNHGLRVSKDITNGDLIMVLDADFIPRANFLWRTVGFFDDAKIGVVQTPQHFFNPDPVQANLMADRLWVDEQRYFYDIVQPSRDAWNTAFCCGTTSIARRRYVEEIGGFPTSSVTEDILLTYVLLQRGYITRYLNEPLSSGLAPEGLNEYLTQRSRWCLGTTQILWLKSCPLWCDGLNITQRLSFLWAIANWLVMYPTTILCLIAPLLYMYFGIYAIEADDSELVSHLAPTLVAMLFSAHWISKRKSLIIMTDVTRLLMVFTIIGSIFQGLFRPFGQRFKVTAKGGSRNHSFVQFSILWKLSAVFLLTAIGIIINLIPEYAVIGKYEQQWINFFWCFFNMMGLLIAALVTIELPRRRSQQRFDVDELSKIIVGSNSLTCIIKDLSITGARIYSSEQHLQLNPLQLNVPGVGNVPCQISRYINSSEIGIQFTDLDGKRDAMIRKVYTSGYNSVSLHANPAGLFMAVLRRFFGREPE